MKGWGNLTFMVGLAVMCVGCSAQLQTFGPEAVIDDPDDAFERINLREVLNPGGQNPTLEVAFQAFSARRPPPTERDRNAIQERILAASNQRCGAYTRYLKSLTARTNFVFGGLTTAAAGAGAIFTPVDTVRALAGIAAILSGIRSEFNEDYWAKQSIHVITAGIAARRKETYENIRARQTESLSAYPVTAAIKDAIEYHNDCSLQAGLEQASQSIQRVENPGVKDVQRFHKLQQTFSSQFGDDENTKRLEKFVGWDGTSFKNQANLEALQQWMKQEGMTQSVVFLLNAKLFAEVRAKAVKDLL